MILTTNVKNKITVNHLDLLFNNYFWTNIGNGRNFNSDIVAVYDIKTNRVTVYTDKDALSQLNKSMYFGLNKGFFKHALLNLEQQPFCKRKTESREYFKEYVTRALAEKIKQINNKGY